MSYKIVTNVIGTKDNNGNIVPVGGFKGQDGLRGPAGPQGIQGPKGDKGDSYDDTEIRQTLDYKQDKIIAGEGIKIGADGKTISSSGGGGDIIQDPSDSYGGIITSGTLADIDKSLSLDNYAADAKIVGERFANIGSNPTNQLVDRIQGDIQNVFYNTSSKRVESNAGCRSIIIDLHNRTSDIISIRKMASSTFSIYLFAEYPEPHGPSAVRVINSINTLTQISIKLDDEEKYALIWYFYNDTVVTAEEILNSMMVNYGTAMNWQPFRAAKGYNQTNDTLSRDNEKQYAIAFSNFDDTRKANNDCWITDYIFSRGYVKSVRVKVNGNEQKSVTVFFIKPYDCVVIHACESTGVGVFEIPVNSYIGMDFYLGIKGENISFLPAPFSRYRINYAAKSGNWKVGDTIPFSFSERADSDTTYILSHEVIYDSLHSHVYDERKVYTHNRMFAVGDSITAGHSSYKPGEHWWENVARDINFAVTPGGRSGSGMSYYNGTNACKIAKNTDFTKYNVAVFAFGTNDYGNDIRLGSFDDTYTYSEDSSQSFYAAVKYVIETVKASNPACTLIFSLPINRTKRTIADNVTGDKTCGSIATKWAYGFANNAGHTLSDYCDAIIECCDHYGIPYIDHRNGAFDVFAVSALLEDGLHPTPEGYKVLGQEMSAKLGSIVKPYVEYNGVGGIGKW